MSPGQPILVKWAQGLEPAVYLKPARQEGCSVVKIESSPFQVVVADEDVLMWDGE